MTLDVEQALLWKDGRPGALQPLSFTPSVPQHTGVVITTRSVDHVHETWQRGVMLVIVCPLVEPSGQTGIVCKFQDAV